MDNEAGHQEGGVSVIKNRATSSHKMGRLLLIQYDPSLIRLDKPSYL